MMSVCPVRQNQHTSVCVNVYFWGCFSTRAASVFPWMLWGLREIRQMCRQNCKPAISTFFLCFALHLKVKVRQWKTGSYTHKNKEGREVCSIITVWTLVEENLVGSTHIVVCLVFCCVCSHQWSDFFHILWEKFYSYVVRTCRRQADLLEFIHTQTDIMFPPASNVRGIPDKTVSQTGSS